MITNNPPLTYVDKQHIVDYLIRCLQAGKRVWCLCPRVKHGLTCNPEDIKEIIQELKSDSYGNKMYREEKGIEGGAFIKNMPNNDYASTECFFLVNNSTNFIEIQYY